MNNSTNVVQPSTNGVASLRHRPVRKTRGAFASPSLGLTSSFYEELPLDHAEIRLSARSARLWPKPAAGRMARQCPHRRAIRPQLRGGWRELRAAWRSGVRAIPVRDRRCRFLSRPPSVDGIDL